MCPMTQTNWEKKVITWNLNVPHLKILKGLTWMVERNVMSYQNMPYSLKITQRFSIGF